MEMRSHEKRHRQSWWVMGGWLNFKFSKCEVKDRGIDSHRGWWVVAKFQICSTFLDFMGRNSTTLFSQGQKTDENHNTR